MRQSFPKVIDVVRKMLGGGGCRIITPTHIRYGMIKTPPSSKALSASIGLNFAANHWHW